MSNSDVYECPKLLVTVETCKDLRGIEEIADALYPYDQSVRVVRTRFSGVLLVYTRLDSRRAYEILAQTPPSVAKRIVRVDACCRADVGEIGRLVLKLLQNVRFEKFYVDCVRRGRYISSSHEVEKTIGALIVSVYNKSVDFRNADVVVKIEVVDDLALISIMKPGEDKEFRRKSLPMHNSMATSEIS